MQAGGNDLPDREQCYGSRGSPRDSSQAQSRVQITGKFVVMRQVSGQARKSIGRSGSESGPAIITWVRHSAVTKQEGP